MKYRLDKGCHSTYALQFHYVACVKYRRKVLSDGIPARLKDINRAVAQKFGVDILEQETDQDHIHILFSGKPSLTLCRFINSLKAVSARLLFQEFPALRRFLWGGHLGSPSYFLATVGNVRLEEVKRYVQSQGDSG